MAELDKRRVTWKNFQSVQPRANRRTGETTYQNGLITREEFTQKISEERATYQRLLNSMPL